MEHMFQVSSYKFHNCMGKKRIATTSSGEAGQADAAVGRGSKRRLESAVVYVESTYNNTRMTLTDKKGNVIASSSAGALGFSGAKKGTPFAAAKVGETVALRATAMGVVDVSFIVRGVGSGRESSIRSFASKGFTITSIKDATPIPFNGPRPPRPRRV
ncbi:MAG: small subunit ribosomal protein S11 [Parcubacteria group bacterium Gr01-1014_72]|nr:MAG: small subunit ribosomal protein S11 [Parcubacteria group bacterium Gr01-1014_72]